MMTIAEKLAVAIALVVIVAVSSCAARTARERTAECERLGGKMVWDSRHQYQCVKP